MNVQQKNKQKGFTIIEVVLVLAIAGLIFLMVFIALPALQRNQRDTQRKNDLSRAQTAVNNYQSNNRGSLPNPSTDANWNSTIRDKYLKSNGDTFADPAGPDYDFQVGGTPPATFDGTAPNIYVTTNAVCNGEAVATGKGSTKVALQMKLEGGGVACVNN
jgi:prepilin-type N-terminal cleavage/methylation domain-containing protein